MKFPGISLIDLRIGHKEIHPVHAEPISLQIGWPPYFSFSFKIPFYKPSHHFWFYIGWEPEFDHYDFTWWALKITESHIETGRDEDNLR